MRDVLDAKVARMFYSAGLSFNFDRNPYYNNAFKVVTKHGLGSYVPSMYNKLRMNLLFQEKSNLLTLLEPLKHNGMIKVCQ